MSLEPTETPDSAAPLPALERRGSRWLKRYPPLVMLVVAVLIAALVLPSALNLPQANPSTVLEYAPVPPEDDEPQTNEGAISELGLGSSSGLSTGAPTPNPQTATGGKGEKPITKRCVGKPPRQTEDPNAPPCVPFFDGDNGGQTWQGVSGEEIVILIYADRYLTTGGSAGGEGSPPVGYCDVDKAPNTDRGCFATDTGAGRASKGQDHFEVVVARTYSRYFNDRFQTYNRRVHIWMYFTDANSAATRRADAQENWDRLKPFAVMQRPAFGGFDDVYTEAIARRRAMVFGALLPRPNEYYRKLAPMIWNFWPDVEHWADQFVSFICQEVAGKPVAYSGEPEYQGKPRKYALMYTTDPRFPALTEFARQVRAGVTNCPDGPSIEISVNAPHRRHQYAIDNHPNAAADAENNIAQMEQQDITTIIWAGGYETEHGKQANEVQYFPEIFVAGDQWHDTIVNGRWQQQDFWSHAVMMSNFLLENKFEDAPCRQAYREADPSPAPPTGSNEGSACNVYRDFFMLFKGIQVAGPYLSPETVDQGQHAIPRQSSTSPYAAACFFDPGDYTCVKDARESWWDPSAPDPDGDADEMGCWRLVEGGKRYLAWEWPGADNAFKNREDPCDNQGNSYDIHPYGPTQE